MARGPTMDRDGERKALYSILTTFVYSSPERREVTYEATCAVIRHALEVGLLEEETGEVRANAEIIGIYMRMCAVPEDVGPGYASLQADHEGVGASVVPVISDGLRRP